LVNEQVAEDEAMYEDEDEEEDDAVGARRSWRNRD
jgi:hypothetical protein